MAKYKVKAVMTSYAYLEVEAEDENEAYNIARETDGGEFIPTDEGDWEILEDEIEEVEDDE